MRKWSGVRLVVVLLLSGLLMVWGAGVALADASTVAATGTAVAASSSGAASGAQQQLTVQQAIGMALAVSPSLISSSYSVNQSQNKVTQQTEPITALNNLTFTPSGNTSSANEGALNNLVAANLNWAQAKLAAQADQDSVTYQVYSTYYVILQDEAALNAVQQSFNLADLQQRIMNLTYQVGGASQNDVIQENQSYAAAQQNLDAAKANLDTDYQKFNQLVGLPTGDRPVLTDQPSFTPLVIGSLAAEVSRVLASDVSISSDQNTVTEQKEALTIVSQDPAANAASADTLGAAQQNLVTEQNNVSQWERNMYYTIQNLESNQTSLQQALTTAEDNLKMVQVEYDVGMDTKVDLATDQSSLNSAQLALLKNTVSHQLDVMAFETPWAAGV
jgi:outer membrane protein TolC